MIFQDEDAGGLVEVFILPDHLNYQKPAAYIHQVFTKEDRRHQGVATKLLKRAIKYAEKQGCYKLFLVCDPSLKPLYEKVGLRETGIEMEVRFPLNPSTINSRDINR